MKRIILLSLLLLSLFLILAVSVSAKTVSGKAVDEGVGDDVLASYGIRYELDTDTGTLRIFCGEQEEEMLSYAKTALVPWLADDLRGHVRTVVVEEGVRSIGRYAFFGCENLTTLYIPQTVTRIEDAVFYGCESLSTVYYQGNQKDFAAKLTLSKDRNDVAGKPLRDVVTFGESVTVICENQEGIVFKTYTVGGYFKGDSFCIQPEAYPGMTYIGRQSKLEGSFIKQDAREYCLTYQCEHRFEMPDPGRPCGVYCAFCGMLDPETEQEHLWEITVKSERGFFTYMVEEETCALCGAHQSRTEPPYFVFIGTALLGLLVLSGIALLVIVPIRRRKKIKELTW